MVSFRRKRLLENGLTYFRRFSGDESFELVQLDAGSELGIVVEGKKKPRSLPCASRL
jgi:hypothetical protein